MSDNLPNPTVVVGYLHRLYQQSQKIIFLLTVIALLCAAGVVELFVLR